MFWILAIFTNTKYSKLENFLIITCIIHIILQTAMLIALMKIIFLNEISIIIAFILNFFPIISSIVTIRARSISHGIIFLTFHILLIILFILDFKICRSF